MKRSRVPGRLLTIGLALARLPFSLFRKKPTRPHRILVLHQLLLGDTLMTTALLAKIREQFPSAQITMAMPPTFIPLYKARPYGVIPAPLDLRDVKTVLGLIRLPGQDLVLLPADTRLSWLAQAMGARWIVGFEGDKPAWKNWFVDELIPCPSTPMGWGDWAALLIEGPAPAFYQKDDWPAPPCPPFEQPERPYVVMHIGSSTLLRRWEPAKWRAVAEWCQDQGFEVALSCGPKETNLATEIDPGQSLRWFAGSLSLTQLWRLLSDARLVISLDTGIAHLTHLAGTPSVILYGPGSSTLFSGGNFWKLHPEEKVFIPDFPCRNENMIFRRHIAWAGHCGRTTKACQEPKCMQAIGVAPVILAAERVLESTTETT